MYLRSLEIAGFKSFGSRVKLELEPGVIGIVGPNGAGKSNLADAIRWVLGEQSTKLLRTRKNEEIIFGGTDSRPRASLAEVTILLDNAEHAMPIEFSEVEITRRLYRSGESEYLLNGRKVRLLDVAEILAQSGFGQNSYSVIGQGMIDNLLLASSVQRKLMFDEASGIRAIELRREATSKKLTATISNLNRTDQTISELTPIRDSLQEKFEAVSRRSKLEFELAALRQTYLSSEAGKLRQEQAELSMAIEQKNSLAREQAERLQNLHADRKARLTTRRRAQKALTQVRDKLSQAEARRDKQYDELAQAQAELKILEAQSGSVAETEKFALSQKQAMAQIEAKLDQIKKNYTKLERKNRDYEVKIAVFDDTLKLFNAELTEYRRRLAKNQKSDYVLHALGLISMLKRELSKKTFNRVDFTIMLHKLSRVVKLASEENIADLLTAINKQQKLITREMTKREELLEAQTTEIIRMRALELDMSYLEKELIELRRHSTQLKNTPESTELNRPEQQRRLVAELKQKVDQADTIINELRAQILLPNNDQQSDENQEALTAIEQLSSAQAALAVESSQLQEKLDSIGSQLKRLGKLANEWGLKIEAATASTKNCSLDDIYRLEGELALLSEVDPSVTKEYSEVKERLQFLQSQHKDLAAAIVDMEKIQHNLDRLIMETFIDSFAKINHKFSHYFDKLFGGGKAELKLQKTESGDYGVEIIASPPGKRVELLASLSGGERALASLALLAAILRVNPSPFVVLDEVDAALDDGNSVKFNQIVKELGRRSQLIIITHNHQTMQQANELVGVAPQPGGDSKLLHVRLQQARELAEI